MVQTFFIFQTIKFIWAAYSLSLITVVLFLSLTVALWTDYYCLQLTAAPICLRPTTLHTLLFHLSLFKASLLYHPRKLQFPFNIFLRRTIPSHPIWGWPSFHLTLDRLLKSIATTFSGQPNVSNTVRWVPKIISRQFLWKTSNKSTSVYRSAQVSEPYLTTVITVASNNLIFARRLFFRTFFQL